MNRCFNFCSYVICNRKNQSQGWKEQVKRLKEENRELKKEMKDLEKEMMEKEYQRCGYCEVEMKPDHWPDCKFYKKDYIIGLPSNEVTPSSVSL